MIAVLLVLMAHLSFVFPDLSVIPAVVRPLFRGGWIGVDLFFVLSGFLISGLLLGAYKRDGHLSIKRFFVRRAWKIYPPFLVMIFVTGLYGKLHQTRGLKRWLAELTFMQSYFRGLWPHTWSLSVEEHFYILLPIALWATLIVNRNSKDPFRPFVAALGVVALLLFLVRIALAQRGPFVRLTHLYPSYIRMDSLGFGVCISYFYHFHRTRFVALLEKRRLLLCVAGIALLAPAFIYSLLTTKYLYTIGLTANYIGAGMLLCAALLTDFSKSSIARSLAVLGAYSYSIYLWHLPLARFVFRPLFVRFGSDGDFWIWFVAYLIGTIGIGMALSKLIEVPALALRDRMTPSPAGPLYDADRRGSAFALGARTRTAAGN